eukprot:1858584-Prorocentrum_lima.AAC.1
MDRHQTHSGSTDGLGQVLWLASGLESVALHELVATVGSPDRRVAHPEGGLLRLNFENCSKSTT